MAENSDLFRIPEPHEFEDAPSRASGRPCQWKALAAVGVCGTIFGFLLGSLWDGPRATGLTTQLATSPSNGVLNSAVAVCGLASASGIEIGDGGSSVTFNGRGREDSFGASLTALSCLLDVLEVPDAARSHINQTTQHDGRQQATWATSGRSVTFSWTFHPDRGLDGVMVESPEDVS